jgi:hypothetical protein
MSAVSVFAVRKMTWYMAPLFGSLELAASLETVHFRHHDIQQDEVGLHAAQHLECLLAVCGGTDSSSLYS